MSNFIMRLLIISICIGTLVSCYSVPSLNKNRTAAINIELVPVDKKDTVLFSNLLEHPYTFSLHEITSVLMSLNYSPRGVIGWDAPQQVFPDQIVSTIAPLIRDKFEEASPLQKLDFSIPISYGSTEGDLFIMQGTLHMRIRAIQGKPHYDPYPSPFDYESETSIQPNWILQPRKGQKYGDHTDFFGLRQDAKNWISTEILMIKAPGNRDHNEGETPSFMVRFQQIMDLRNSRLISEDAYIEKSLGLKNEAKSSKISPHAYLTFLSTLHEHGLLTKKELLSEKQRILDSL